MKAYNTEKNINEKRKKTTRSVEVSKNRKRRRRAKPRSGRIRFPRFSAQRRYFASMPRGTKRRAMGFVRARYRARGRSRSPSSRRRARGSRPTRSFSPPGFNAFAKYRMVCVGACALTNICTHTHTHTHTHEHARTHARGIGFCRALPEPGAQPEPADALLHLSEYLSIHESKTSSGSLSQAASNPPCFGFG